MKIIKKSSPDIIPHLVHIIYSIIRTGKYPSILKVNIISPILKPDKIPENINSYCPINNLSVVDKIIEEYIKGHLNDSIDYNGILLDDHHGSRKYHGTTFALTVINHHLINRYHDDYINTVIQMVLSAAFDTEDHNILLKKLEY